MFGMTFEAQFERAQFIKAAILYHIQRKQVYSYAIIAAIVTVFAVSQQMFALLVVVWLSIFL